MDMPLVDPQDDGIRPAGPQDACLYCRSKIGTPHDVECVCVTRIIEMRVDVTMPDGETFAGYWTTEEPYHWGADHCEFHKNESSWCQNNFLREEHSGSVRWLDVVDPWGKLNALAITEDGDSERDICGTFKFIFERVVDGTPRREIRRVE